MAGITVTSTETDYAFTIAEVKDYLKISGSDDDTTLTMLQIAAHNWAKNFTQRSITTQTLKLSIDAVYQPDIVIQEGTYIGIDQDINRRSIILPQSPVASISNVKYYADDDTETTFASSKYYLDNASVPAKFVLRQGGIYNSFVTVTMNSSRHDPQSLFDNFGGVFDDREGLFDGNYTEFDDVKAVIQISTSTDNSTYTDFQDYVLGYYKARYIKLRVKMETTNITSTPAISQLVATIDMPDRTIASDDVASGTASGGKAVSFSPAFKSLEGLGISADNLATGDFYEIVSKSETGFTIRFKNSSGSVVDRTFGFVAKGFGFLESS